MRQEKETYCSASLTGLFSDALGFYRKGALKLLLLAFLSQTLMYLISRVTVPANVRMNIFAEAAGWVVWGIWLWVRGALFLACYHVVDESKSDILDALLDVRHNFISFALTYVVYGLAVVIGLFVFIVPGLYLGIVLSFAPLYGVIGRKSVVESVTASVRIARANFWLTTQVFIGYLTLCALSAAYGYFVFSMLDNVGGNFAYALSACATVAVCAPLDVLWTLLFVTLYRRIGYQSTPEDFTVSK